MQKSILRQIIEAAADEIFYQLLKLDSGVKLEETNYPIYSDLEKTLAKRTYDESGNYITNTI